MDFVAVRFEPRAVHAIAARSRRYFSRIISPVFPSARAHLSLPVVGVKSSSGTFCAPAYPALRSLPSALLQLVLPVRLNTFRVAEAAERFSLSHGSGVQNLRPEVFKRGDPPRRIKSCARELPGSLPPSLSPRDSLALSHSPFPPLFLFQPARYLTEGKRLSPLKSPHFCNLYFFH